ncbi:cupin domain-containing protein [Reichenbachiella agariperforans]|uniref:cupin domain-containing protein n=1 Tax=Reichenbachiella agariperforans TaxID=156994 RepID=UPI001C099F29|nr:cupin domain-containing protein [Reichenbachiella agariperforans]MBU2915299.1 cupin domain-containing protein [Reichenbachiella agariperforans]
MTDLDNLIQTLALVPHPEGGYYKETYRSTDSIQLASPFDGTRNYSTCIYYLLTSETFSAFHRIKQDEIWHFYQGATIDLHLIHPDGRHELIEIGHDLGMGQVPQYVVPAGVWFAAEVAALDAHALVGCTVSPGFDFKDFELANRADLNATFPDHSEVISRLTRC